MFLNRQRELAYLENGERAAGLVTDRGINKRGGLGLEHGEVKVKR